jgi:enterochelin esterase family protein
LRAFQRDLRKRKRAALKPFWQRVTRSGTPLIEPLKVDRHRSILTFLWKHRRGTERVAVRSLAFGLFGPNTELSRIPKSDVWYRSYIVPNDFRDAYKIAVNDSLEDFSSWEEWGIREKTWLLDPRNAHRIEMEPDRAFPKDPLNNNAYSRSLVDLPRAPRHRELNPRRDVPQGTLQRYRFRSQILGDSRRIWVYRPAGFRADDRRLRVAVVFDGSWYTSRLIPTPTILDNLAAEGKIPPVLGVFVDARRLCTDRLRDMVYRPEPFGQFLVQELLPWVEKTVGVHCHPDRTALVGLSGGGLCALRFALQYPEHFRLVLSQSGSFWAEDPVRHEPGSVIGAILARPRPLPLRIYMEAGTFENRAGDGEVSLLGANRHVRDVLRLKGYAVTYREFHGGHEFQCWRQSLVDVLPSLMGPRAAWLP